MKKLDTFNKATKFGKAYHSRINSTIDFMKDCNVKSYSRVLDITEPNKAGGIISSMFDHSLSNTTGNLDTVYWECPEKNYKYVYCFEVLEHLLNPLLFLNQLKIVAPKARVIITVPYHILRPDWGIHHFHEMDLSRLHYLFDMAGMRVINFRRKNFYSKPSLSEPMAILTGKTKMNKSLWTYFKKLKYIINPILYFITGYFWIKKTVRYYFICEFV